MAAQNPPPDRTRIAAPATSPAALPPGAIGAVAPHWVPVRSLGERHRSRIRAHLQELNEGDRYFRFGYVAGDDRIAAYVDGLDFDRDEVFGIFNRRLELLALAHLASVPATPTDPAMAEFGVSVRRTARGRGYGARLFEHAMLHARNRGVDTVVVHALSENAAMLQIARNAGASVVRDGSESEARLKLPPDDLASRVEARVQDGAAELDYGLKAQARLVDQVLHMIADVRQGLSKLGHPASE